jgi:hypothetical protein
MPVGVAVVEAARNLAARPVRTAIRVLGGAVVLAVCVHAQVGARHQLVDEWREQVSSGRFVFTAAPGDGTLGAVDCETATRRHSDVVAAGAVLQFSSDRSVLNERGDLNVTTITPGLFQLAYPTYRSPPAGSDPTGGVYVGAGIASDLGVRPGGRLALESRGVVSVLGVLPASGRLPQLDQSLVEVAVPAENARFCYLEARPGTDSADFAASVAGIFPRPLRMLVGPLHPQLDRGDRNPEHRLARLSVLTPLLGTLVIAALALADWFERRRELALYRLLGAPGPSAIAMIGTDFVLASLLPWSIGALAGLALTRATLHEPIIATGTLLELTAAYLVLAPVPALAWLALRQTNPVTTLKAT